MLFRKMLRDMRWNKMLFVSIFLLSYLGVFLYAGIGGETIGVKRYLDWYNKETNLANGWIYSEGFNKEELEAIRNIEDITDAQRRLYMVATGVSDHSPQIHMYFEEENIISKPYVVEGDPYDPLDSNRVWLDKNFADASGIKVGDTYGFNLNGIILELEIGGLIYSPEYTYYVDGDSLFPDFSKIGFAFTSYTAFPQKDYVIKMIQDEKMSITKLLELSGLGSELESIGLNTDMIMKDMLLEEIKSLNTKELSEMIPFVQIVFTTKNKDVSKLEEKIEDALEGQLSYFIKRENVVGVAQLEAEMEQHESMMVVFPIAFVLIAILAIITTMNRLVNNQRTQIGTLKALGMKKRKIIAHYMSYSFWISLLGSTLGLILGPITIPKVIFNSLSEAYSIPEWRGGYDISFFVVAMVTVFACSFVTYFTCRRILAINPATTLRPAAPKEGKRSIFELLPFWNKLGFSTRYNLRDLGRSKIRTLMGFMGALCCMALLVCSASMYDSFRMMADWMYEDIENYDTKLKLANDIPLQEAEGIRDELQGELIMENGVIIRHKGEKKTLSLYAVEGAGLYRVTDVDLNILELEENDIAITMKAAKALGITEGDVIEWHLIDYEEWVEGTVTIINRMPVGSAMVTTRKNVEDAGYTFAPTLLASKDGVGDYTNPYVTAVHTKEDINEAWDKSMETMLVMIIILIVMAIGLALLVMYNLGILAYAEREREMATLKVVGFNTKRLKKLLLIQNTWLCVLGVLAGTPCGIFMVQYMVDVMGDSFDMIALISLPSFLLCALGTIGVSFLVSLLFSGKIKKLDMVAALKGAE